MMDEEEIRSEILSVVETKQGIYYLRIDYEEGDIGNGSGYIYKTSGTRTEDQPPDLILSANESLDNLWVSNSGSFWVSSSNGNVATTASLPWFPAGTGDGVGYENGAIPWVVIALPPEQSSKLPPNITALWGIDNSNVFVGTYGGHIYQWNGKIWRQTYEGPDNSDGTIVAFGGDASDSIFAAGHNGTLLHSNGSAWQSVLVPGDGIGRETFTAVVALSSGAVLISSSGNQSRLLHGTGQGILEFGRYDIPLIGMTLLGDRVLFATGDGCAELFGKEIRIIKDSFLTVDVFPGIGRVFFIEPDQPVPGYVEYAPQEGDDAWSGVEF